MFIILFLECLSFQFTALKLSGTVDMINSFWNVVTPSEIKIGCLH